MHSFVYFLFLIIGKFTNKNKIIYVNFKKKFFLRIYQNNYSYSFYFIIKTHKNSQLEK